MELENIMACAKQAWKGRPVEQIWFDDVMANFVSFADLIALEERERCALEIKRMAKTKPYHPTKSCALYDAVNVLLALDHGRFNPQTDQTGSE